MIKHEQVNLNERITNLKSEVIIENQSAYANIKFRNLAYGIIRAIKFECTGYNSLGEIVEVDGCKTFSLVCQDLKIATRGTAIVKVLLPNNNIRQIEIHEKKICYDNGTIIDVEPEELVEYEYDIPDVDSEEYELIEIIKENNDKAVCFPCETANGYICVWVVSRIFRKMVCRLWCE